MTEMGHWDSELTSAVQWAAARTPPPPRRRSARVGDELAAAATDQVGELGVDTSFNHGVGSHAHSGSGWWIIIGAFWLGSKFTSFAAATAAAANA